MPRSALPFLVVAACGGSGPATSALDAPVKIDAAPVSPQTLGSSCSCNGSDCDSAGVPEPTQGTIVGCDHVATNWPGGQRACMRSYDGSFATSTYFANGYCAIMAASCTGASLICNSATAGDYDNMVACPTGSVMLEDTTMVSVFNQSATVHTKLCVQSCGGASDCRTSETDPVWSAPTQYQCLDQGGVKFCYDARNLSASYTAMPF
jgi:hypothetical protein